MSNEVVWLTPSKKFLTQKFVFEKNGEGAYQGHYKGEKTLPEARLKELEEASFPNGKMAAQAVAEFWSDIEAE